MQNSPIRRALAVFLACQPVFWMSNVALAQAIQAPFASPPGGAAPTLPVPVAPGDTEVVRPERGVLSTAAPPAPPVDAPLDPDAYVLGPGDLLELNFWGVQNFKLRATIDLEGRAFVAKVGYLPLKGKTLSEARRVLRDSVARYFPQLSFDVALAEPRTFLVQLVDAVARPGAYSARAVDRVAAVIARAGGFGPRASQRRVEIRRRSGEVVKADLLLYSQTGDVKQNPYLLDGDVVRVPFEDLAVAIDGAVNRPGRYELVGTRDLAELVELGGGLSATATKLLPVSLVRRQEDDHRDLKLLSFGPNGELPSAPLQHEDAVRVPTYEELQRSVLVVGALAGVAPPTTVAGQEANGGGRVVAADEATSTRRLPFVQGDSVRTLLERVGGVGSLADLKGSYVLRGAKTIPVDLYSLVMLHDLRADTPIELGDTLVVPFKRRNILVEGAVFRPGSYPYNPSYGVEQYLSLAGGRNRFAQSLSDVRVISPHGETIDFKSDLKVEPGSSVVVPERNFSRSEVVQIMLGVASLVVSGVAVVLAARK
jgi:polysaccharide export outer membrane protein